MIEPTIGPADTVTALRDYVASVMPSILSGTRTAYGLTPEVLPDPALITSAELSDIPDYRRTPALLIVPERLVSLAPRPGGQVAEASYQVAVEGYVRGVRAEDCADLNRRYAAMTRQALASHPGRPTAAYGLRIVASTLAEEYYPVFQEQSGRWISGFRTTVTVHRAESLQWPAPPSTLDGQVDQIDVTTQIVGPDRPMPHHPAL